MSTPTAARAHLSPFFFLFPFSPHPLIWETTVVVEYKSSDPAEPTLQRRPPFLRRLFHFFFVPFSIFSETTTTCFHLGTRKQTEKRGKKFKRRTRAPPTNKHRNQNAESIPATALIDSPIVNALPVPRPLLINDKSISLPFIIRRNCIHCRLNCACTAAGSAQPNIPAERNCDPADCNNLVTPPRPKVSKFTTTAILTSSDHQQPSTADEGPVRNANGQA